MTENNNNSQNPALSKTPVISRFFLPSDYCKKKVIIQKLENCAFQNLQ